MDLVETDGGDAVGVSEGSTGDRTDMRRRRSGGTWFPTVGTENVNEEDTFNSGFDFSLFLAEGSSSILTVITPITVDSPQESPSQDLDTTGLAEIIGNEYLLKRIVGKCFISRIGQEDVNGNDPNPPALVGAGFFIARANDSAVGGGNDTPVGSATEPERRDNYSPLTENCIREPWIWRRTWMLGTAGRNRAIPGVANTLVGAIDSNTANFPASTSLYGSVADGPHIDSRVKRKVGQDDRLWFAVSVSTFPVGTLTTDLATPALLGVQGYLDFRIFGQLRKARGSSAF